MSDIIETRDVNGFTVNVRVQDFCDMNPRKEYENLGTFFGFHGRYVSPDDAPDSDPQEARRIAESADNICLPVWLYDHSGTCYRAAPENPFHCPWDSGCFGFIYCTRADARKAMNKKRLSAADVEMVKAWLMQEVETYSAWANGEVYGFEVLDGDGEQVDSCWGFIGESDYAMAQGVESAEWHGKEAA